MTDPGVRTILLATDLGPRCDRAAERAVALARHWQAKLHVLTVLEAPAPLSGVSGPGPLPADEARRRAEASLRGYAGATIHVLVGRAETAIVALAEQVHADIIVTGPSGTQWLGQTVLGQTVGRLMRYTHVPVLLVKAPADRPYRRVVAAMDLSDASRAPVETAFRLFGPQASLSLFHAFSTPFRLFVEDGAAYEAGMREGVILEIRDALKAWAIDTADSVPVIADYGDPATKLAELATTLDIDVVVTGTHGRTGLMHVLLGSVAGAILEKLACDVLVVPSRGAWPG